MFKSYRQFGAFLLWCGLLSLMAGCGAASNNNSNNQSDQAAISDAQQAMHQLEDWLNTGKVDEALELFEDSATLLVKNPLYTRLDETGNYIQQELSYDNQVTYQNKDGIKSYLFSLVHNHFSTSQSQYHGGAAEVSWVCQVRLDDAELIMEFNATFGSSKIQELLITNRQLVSWPINANNSSQVNSTDLPVPISNPSN